LSGRFQALDVSAAIPWATLLPKRDRMEFVDELSRTLLAASALDNYAPVAQLLREWTATAEVHADPRLARRLRAAIVADGGLVRAPEA
jgi:uncharacterized protein DUF6247